MPEPTYPPGVLQNRLANERTLLAWLRTAVALMGFGVMVARLGMFLETMVKINGHHATAASQSRWMGASLLLAGSVVAAIGHQRTKVYARVIHADDLPPRNGALTYTSMLVGLLGVGLALLVLFMD